MGGQRAIDQARLRVDPAQAVGVQDERVVARDGRHPRRVLGRAVVRRLVGLEVGVVAQRVPPALLGVPPDVALALRPRVAVRVGRRAVVEDPPVGRPRPAPLVGDPVLLAARLPARRPVDAVGVDPRVDPRAAARRAVLGERLISGDERAVGPAAVDLLQDGRRVRLAAGGGRARRVVPGQVEDRAVLEVGRAGQPVADA